MHGLVHRQGVPAPDMLIYIFISLVFQAACLPLIYHGNSGISLSGQSMLRTGFICKVLEVVRVWQSALLTQNHDILSETRRPMQWCPLLCLLLLPVL